MIDRDSKEIINNSIPDSNKNLISLKKKQTQKY